MTTNAAGMKAVAKALLDVLNPYTSLEQTWFESEDRALGDKLREAVWALNGGCPTSQSDLEKMDVGPAVAPATATTVGALAMGPNAQVTGSWGVAVGPSVTVTTREHISINLEWLRGVADGRDR